MIRGIRIGTAAERNGPYGRMGDEAKVSARAPPEEDIAADAGARR